jgi:protein required for attachment to host cells
MEDHMNYWLLVADAAQARVYSSRPHLKSLRLERQISNPRGRARPQEIMADQPGRYAKGGKNGIGSAMEPRTNPHEVEEKRFALELAELFQTGLDQKAYDGLALVAPPEFLGLLKNSLSPRVQQRVVSCVGKDLTKVGIRDLPRRLNGIALPGIQA